MMRVDPKKVRRPFWVPASNYYVLAGAVSVAFFFLVWGILHDEGAEMPWINAGLGASIVLSGAVILREVILRRARSRLAAQQRAMAGRFHGRGVKSVDHGKLTLEQNAAFLNEIRQKSDAAKVLNKVAAGHREVFDLCAEYLARNEHELKTVSAGSPRLTALLKGRSSVGEYHRYHLLKWAEIESRTLAEDARARHSPDERVASAQRSVDVVNWALRAYPMDESLLQSRDLLEELVVSVKVTNLIEDAERAVFNRDYRGALDKYREALFHLGRDAVESEARNQAAIRINAAIEKIIDIKTD